MRKPSNKRTKDGEDLDKFSGVVTSRSGLSGFTNKDKFSKLSDTLSNGNTNLKINNTTVAVAKTSTGFATTAFNSAVSPGTITKTVSAYTAPTRLALDAFSNCGKDIDKSLKGSFLLQTLNIKGTDILCAAFCYVISMLPCSERQAIYDMLKNASKAAQSINVATSAANQTINTIGASMASVDAIAKSASNLFAGNATKLDAGRANDAIATIAAAPASIMKNINLITNMLKLGSQYKMIMPNTAGHCIWDLSGNVLFALQGMAVQAADEALSKITNPIEEKIKGLIPSICFGTMAVRLQQAIIQKIREFKAWLISQVSDLFVASSDFNKNFKSKVDQSALSLELLAFSITLNQITSNFFSIAKGCGVAPCNDNGGTLSDWYSDDIGNLESISNEDPLDVIKTKPRYINRLYTPRPSITGTGLEELAAAMAPSLALGKDPKIQVTPDEVLAVYSIADTTLPSKIVDIISNGGLDSILDNNYSIYVDDADVKVVYRFDKKCGEK